MAKSSGLAKLFDSDPPAQLALVQVGSDREQETAVGAHQARPAPTPARKTGYPMWGIVLSAGLAIVALLWAMWVTKQLIDPQPHSVPMVAVRLQPIVEEFVQGEARASTNEQQLMARTQAFMAALDKVLKARGADGTTVMVAEAVLSKNVPDVTADVRRSVYQRLGTTPPSLPASPPPSQSVPSATLSLPPLSQGR